VPLFSWLASRGRCRHCQAPISWRYPATELTCGAWALLLWTRVGPTPAFPLLALWGFLLVALFWIDLDFQLLPDALTFPGVLIGIAAALVGPGARHALLGVVVGSGLLWLVGELYFRVRKIEGMGGGDVKLAAMFGAVLGPAGTLLAILLASLIGAVCGGILIARGQGTGRTALPFGAFLCPAAMVACLWGDAWIGAYLSLFGR
jgi:leader peptidase (prepilin peptidase)/N-methyltransferase